MKCPAILLTAMVIALGSGLGGCSKGDADTEKVLVDIQQRLKNIEGSLADLEKGGVHGAAARPTPVFPPEPDPSQVYSVSIEGAPYEGAKSAKVTVVKAFEFACPFCQRVIPTLDQLLEDYKGDLKIVYKNLIVHPKHATIPALATCAAHKQGKFIQMKNVLWEKGFPNRLAEADMEAFAKEVGLKVAQFKADMNGDECQKMVQQDEAEMRRVGVRGTPGFFINGRYLRGAQPLAEFKVLVDEELKKANERIAQGTKVENYYNEFVLNQGKKTL